MSEELKPSCALFLPERKGLHLHYDALMPTYSKAWNACLDEVAHLNPCRVQAVPSWADAAAPSAKMEGE